MADYRAYIVGRDGHFVRSEGFTARDDGEAIIKAKSLMVDLDIELWCGDRFILRLSHKDAP